MAALMLWRYSVARNRRTWPKDFFRDDHDAPFEVPIEEYNDRIVGIFRCLYYADCRLVGDVADIGAIECIKRQVGGRLILYDDDPLFVDDYFQFFRESTETFIDLFKTYIRGNIRIKQQITDNILDCLDAVNIPREVQDIIMQYLLP